MNLLRDRTGFTHTLFRTILKSNLCPVNIIDSSDSTTYLGLDGSMSPSSVPGNLGDVKDNLKPELVRRLVEKELYESSLTATGVLGVRFYWGNLGDTIILNDRAFRILRMHEDYLLCESMFLRVHTDAMMTPDATISSYRFARSYFFQRNAGVMATQDVKPSLFFKEAE